MSLCGRAGNAVAVGTKAASAPVSPSQAGRMQMAQRLIGDEKET
jgi:hypothetical protein